MTFDEVRNKYHKELGDVMIDLRTCVMDPEMINPMYKKYTELRQKLDSVLNKIIRLNNAEQEAK